MPYGYNQFANESNKASPPSGGFNLADFMSKYSQGGGLFGLGDIATGGLFSAGSSLLGGLGGLLGGKSDSEKRGDEVYNLAKNRMGQSVLDPDQYLADYKRSMLPEWNRSGEAINRRLGLDSGAAQSDLAYRRQSDEGGFLLNMKAKADQLKNQNDNMLLQLMSQFGER